MKYNKKLNPILEYFEAEGYDISKSMYNNGLVIVLNQEKVVSINTHNDSFEITLYEHNEPISTDFVEGLNEIVDQIYWWEKE